MNIIITGAAGFIGQALASALLLDSSVSSLTLTDLNEPTIPSSSTTTPHHHQPSIKTKCIAADLRSSKSCTGLFTADVSAVFLLHGLMSGAAEANLELGLAINLDSVRQVLDTLRAVNPTAKVVFTSSCAVYGPSAATANSADALITELNTPIPSTSYGAQKLICETLLNDYSRRDLLDGRIVRLPTILVRPGAPSGAASSFASSIFREPLRGLQTRLPLPRSQEIWISSPRTVTAHLIHALSIPKDSFRGGSRVVNLPGLTVSVQDMLNVLREVGGQDAVALVEEVQDEGIKRIVESWPTRLNTSRAWELGFAPVGSLADAVREYVEDYSRSES